MGLLVGKVHVLGKHGQIHLNKAENTTGPKRKTCRGDKTQSSPPKLRGDAREERAKRKKNLNGPGTTQKKKRGWVKGVYYQKK